jgi:alkanesulfonate monooxygenase SsuD/methylene tetrahydromethanopterin reductase-like flavin-dependent oxidoreductase (luciferase family)
MNRMMTLVAFLQAQNCSNLPGSWRHPSTMLDFTTPEYYQRIARTLEDGKIQLAFFDDRLALPDLYTGHHAEAIGAGVRAVKMDPSTILMAMGMATTKLGLGTTYSTTYYEPYHVARVFATMDLMLKGRVAWNIVTSLNSAEALNFGQTTHMEHDARYDRADEFMDVVMGHWNTWEDDALILDKAGQFADPAKVHRLDHVGNYFKSRGESEDAAQAKRAIIEESARPVDALVLISEVLNYDFGAKGYDEPFSDEELASFSWHGFRERVVKFSGKKNPTVRDFVEVSGRGTIAEHKVFCGTAKSVADQMEEWFVAPACDGFVLAATHMPGAYEDAVRLVVPELQRRGLFQKEYRGNTLRENLGLPIPNAADWHQKRKAAQ